MLSLPNSNVKRQTCRDVTHCDKKARQLSELKRSRDTPPVATCFREYCSHRVNSTMSDHDMVRRCAHSGFCNFVALLCKRNLISRTVQTVAQLLHSKRSLRLEWSIVVLIAIETHADALLSATPHRSLDVAGLALRRRGGSLSCLRSRHGDCLRALRRRRRACQRRRPPQSLSSIVLPMVVTFPAGDFENHAVAGHIVLNAHEEAVTALIEGSAGPLRIQVVQCSDPHATVR